MQKNYWHAIVPPAFLHVQGVTVTYRQMVLAKGLYFGK